MDHSTYLYLIDREGVVRYLFRYEDPPERIAAVVDKLL
jgi:cytochrome oxidase Cu insertion factor (SCO1/SenC/PrrC family)